MSKYNIQDNSTNNKNWILKTVLGRFYERKIEPILSHSFNVERQMIGLYPFKSRDYICSACGFEVTLLYIRDGYAKIKIKGFIVDDYYSNVNCDEIAMEKALM